MGILTKIATAEQFYGDVYGNLFGSASAAESSSFAASASYSTFSDNAQTSSLTVTASYALTASFLLGGIASASYAVNAESSSYFLMSNWATNNFADDTAAAAGGVPLGGIYRSGNVVVVRTT